MKSLGRKLTLVGIACACTGCSLASLSAPPENPAKRNRQTYSRYCGEKNGPWLYPLADATWVAGGIADIAYTNKALEGERDGTSISSLKLWRGVGYVEVAVAGVSMIYGVIVAGRCAGLKSEIEKRSVWHEEPTAQTSSDWPAERSQPDHPGHLSRRFVFPARVSGFAFGSTPASAQTVCASLGGGSLSFEGTLARCTQRDPNKPSVWLEYELGSLRRVSVVYPTTAEEVDFKSDSLATGLSESYGAETPVRAESTSCAGSTLACLRAGLRPERHVWQLPGGSIEETPRLDGERLVVELRFSSGAAPRR